MTKCLLSTIAILVAVADRPCPAAGAGAAPPRWNILFVFADDWGRYASCYRGLDGRPGLNDVVATPAIDRLAREGVLFRNTFVSSPSCTPCRSSLLSGRPFFSCGRGAILLNAVWDDSIPTFPLLLEGAGYRIGKSYKVWSPGRPVDAPFGGQRRAFETAGRLPNDFSENATKMVAAGKTFAAAKEAIVAQIRGNFRTFLADAAGLLDSTLVVASGDHGMPGVPHGKCELHDHGTAVPLVARVPGGTPGRIVDDFVSLPELAPTFLEVAGVPRPEGMTAPSLLPALLSDHGGQIDAARSFVITGRERHVDTARDGNLPYPTRAIRTADHLYIRNFAPDRLPMGRPGIAATGGRADAKALEINTFAAYPDMDASPTKAWVIRHGTEGEWRWLADYSFAPRPAEELYDLRADPDQIKNLAADPAQAAVHRKLAARLDAELLAAGDPRLAADVPFEKPPFTDVEPRGRVSGDRGSAK